MLQKEVSKNNFTTIAHGLITVDGQMIPFLPVTSGRWKVNTIEFQLSNDWFWKTYQATQILPKVSIVPPWKCWNYSVTPILMNFSINIQNYFGNVIISTNFCFQNIKIVFEISEELSINFINNKILAACF